MKNTRGKFIVFEGGEGSGKSSSIETAVKVIERAGHKVWSTREPGGTPGAEAIRDILIADDANYDPLTNALLFASARRDHIEKLIKPKLDEGCWIVSDRFVLSTIAYQGAGEGVDAKTIKDLHALTTNNFLPDLTIVMDVDPEIGVKRSLKRLSDNNISEGRFESFDMSFHHKLRQAMLDYDESPKIIIDATPPMDEVQSCLEEEISKYVEKA